MDERCNTKIQMENVEKRLLFNSIVDKIIPCLIITSILYMIKYLIASVLIFKFLDQSENCNQLSFLSFPQGNKTAVIGN